MFNEEIASLLDDAGYRFNPGTRRYDVTAGQTEGEEEGHSPEFVADELGIPVDDLQRWEEEQVDAAPAPGEIPADESPAAGAPEAQG